MMRVDAKVVMLGKESVGKTSLVERYVHHRFLVGPYQNVSVSCPGYFLPSDSVSDLKTLFYVKVVVVKAEIISEQLNADRNVACRFYISHAFYRNLTRVKIYTHAF